MSSKVDHQPNCRFENLLGLIGGGREAYSTDPDEKSRREEGVDMRFVCSSNSFLNPSPLFLLLSRDDEDVVRYSCSQPPDLIPRQSDVELEEVLCSSTYSVTFRQCLPFTLNFPNKKCVEFKLLLQVSITLDGLCVSGSGKDALPEHIEKMVQTALKDMN